MWDLWAIYFSGGFRDKSGVVLGFPIQEQERKRRREEEKAESLKRKKTGERCKACKRFTCICWRRLSTPHSLQTCVASNLCVCVKELKCIIISPHDGVTFPPPPLANTETFDVLWKRVNRIVGFLWYVTLCVFYPNFVWMSCGYGCVGGGNLTLQNLADYRAFSTNLAKYYARFCEKILITWVLIFVKTCLFLVSMPANFNLHTYLCLFLKVIQTCLPSCFGNHFIYRFFAFLIFFLFKYQCENVQVWGTEHYRLHSISLAKICGKTFGKNYIRIFFFCATSHCDL